jgi:hypothetical protein
MITYIDTIVAVPGGIKFTVTTDGDSDDVCYTIIGGNKYSKQVTCRGEGPHPGQLISTSPESGPHNIIVRVKDSDTSSGDGTPVVLIATKGAGGK